jgi:hypothetical protein
MIDAALFGAWIASLIWAVWESANGRYWQREADRRQAETDRIWAAYQALQRRKPVVTLPDDDNCKCGRHVHVKSSD